MQWNFREQEAGEQTRDPIIGEFFSTDAIENPAEALVREGIQNALDAGNKNQVRVRIFLADGENALPPQKWKEWFDGAWPHITAERNGLREKPAPSDPCAFLVFEDFGTSGLNGNTEQPFDEPGIANPFFYFFRAEGRSGKGEGDRGRWGVGKHVFPRSSGISSFFGLSVRSNDQEKILMGRTILKSHKIGAAHYCPDGYLGVSNGKFTTPITDAAIQDRFAASFNIVRTNESGLSIVVPFVDADMSVEHLVLAVMEGYFWPILNGQLVVSVGSHAGSTELNANTLEEIAATRGLKEMAANLALAEAAKTIVPSELIYLNPCDHSRPVWIDSLVPEANFEALRERLTSGGLVAVRAQLSVRKKGDEPAQPSYFDIFIRQDGCEKGRPVFIREGIIISDARSPRTRGVRSLVVVDHKPIATLLGDAENPAHTQWQKDSSNFKGKYLYGPSYIEFVTKVVHNLVVTLQSRDGEVNKTILSDLFYLPPDDANNKIVRPDKDPKQEPGKNSEPDETEIEPSKKRFRLKRVDGGFTIVCGDVDTVSPARLDIRLAYDVRKGNPLKKYDPADFRVQSQPIRIDPATKNVSLTTLNDNHIVGEIRDADFVLTITGFDKNRDLFIKARIEEDVDAT